MPIRRILFAPALVATMLAAACASSPPPPQAPPAPAKVAPSSSLATAAPTPAAAEPRPLASAESLLHERARCLADASCSRADLDRLVLAADDAGAAEDCMLFYYGVGVAKDAARARACYERGVRAEAPCNGSSPTLERVMLATMMLDGQGGPKATRAEVEKLFDGCFTDAAVKGLFEASTHAKGPIDFCADVGGTTLSMEDCGREASRRLGIERLLLRKDLAKKLSAEALAREDAASRAFAVYVDAASKLAADDARGGTMAGLEAQGEEQTLLEARNERLRALAVGAQPAVGGAAPAAYSAALKKVMAAAHDQSARELVAKADVAFQAWRPAEAAFARAAAAPGDAATAEVVATSQVTAIAIESLERRLQSGH